ncbi:MAG: SufE family protein [Pseudomonadales bacterium]|nr:SufE family protein [Pseudomonadales bacterium]
MVDLDNIKTTFAFFDDWEDKYRFLIDLGKSVPVLSSEFRIAENLVRGCQSQVWLLGEYDGEQHRLRLQIDSDAHIVRGLIAIVLATFDERSPNEIVDYDIEHLFKELDLLNHLSVTRGNGLRALVKRINDTASSYLKN